MMKLALYFFKFIVIDFFFFFFTFSENFVIEFHLDQTILIFCEQHG
jgi:hypothetical protein